MENQPLKSSPFFEINQKIDELIALVGIDRESLSGNLIEQMIVASLRIGRGDLDRGQLKLMLRAFKEMGIAYLVFNRHRTGRCISIFGSSRTLPSHPNYQTAKAFGLAMEAKGWKCIVGASTGIMRAALEGFGKQASFGLSIRLSFEPPDVFLKENSREINFNYFFTRKLMFLSQSDALAVFPGGVGTQDELFETLTLMQTGKTSLVPVVLVEQEGGNYWQVWENWVREHLLMESWISQEDFNFFYRAPDFEKAIKHVEQFYHRYHSSRYVKDLLVIRLLTPLTPQQLALLTEEFRPLIRQGNIEATPSLSEEDDHLTLPRIAFEHNRSHFGLLRLLIDRINSF